MKSVHVSGHMDVRMYYFEMYSTWLRAFVRTTCTTHYGFVLEGNTR